MHFVTTLFAVQRCLTCGTPFRYSQIRKDLVRDDAILRRGKTMGQPSFLTCESCRAQHRLTFPRRPYYLAYVIGFSLLTYIALTCAILLSANPVSHFICG